MRCIPPSRAGAFINRFCSRLNRVLATAFAAALITASAAAQAPATGTIRGNVTNATNGRALENVVLRATGAPGQAITNSYGDYEFTNVPAGEVEIRASYVGEPDIVTRVTVPAGDVVRQDLRFREEAVAGATQTKDGALELSPYIVNAERYRNARAVATAEERNSINIKNVVATDQFGYIPSGNVGEFVKFLPGVQLDYGTPSGGAGGYSESAANGVSIRGFGPEDTTILIDGLPVMSTLPGSLTRQTGLDQLSINNAERVELIKVATPDMPMNSVGGQINLITRNAFEYAKPTYSGRLFFNWNTMQNDILKKTPGPVNKHTFKTTPGFDGTIAYPVSKTLGISFTAAWNQEYSENWRAQMQWNNNNAANYLAGAFTNAAGQATSLSNPVLTRYQITNTPMMTEKRSGNFRVDWRPTPNQTLRANIQYSDYDSREAQRRLDFRPTIANGIVWDGTQVVGNIANSNTAMTVTTRDRVGDTISGSLQYDANFWGFQINAAGSYSMSKADYEDAKNGHFSGLDLNLNPGRVALYGLNEGIPSRAETFTRTTNLPLNYTDLANWSGTTGAKAQSGEAHNEKENVLWKVDVSRPLDFLHFLGSNRLVFQTGFRHEEETNTKSGRGTGYAQILKPGASFTVADIIDTDYIGVSPGFGLAPQQWASTYKLYQLNQAKDLFYEPTENESTNTAVNNYNSYVNQQKALKEGTDGWYGMLSGTFFDGRLNFVGGARQEKKFRNGKAPFTDNKWNYVKNKDGSLYTDATNPNGVTMNSASSVLFANTAAGTALRSALTAAGIAFPTTPYGATNSDINARRLQLIPMREVDQELTGDPSYSVNAAYQLTKKINFKVAYSRSFKLPNLEDGSLGLISGNNQFTVTEYTESEQLSNGGAKGQISIANPALLPETSDNWDFETSYYTDNGGKLTVSYYTKDITNQAMTVTTYDGTPAFNAVLNAMGLNPSEYADWRVVTSTNADTVQKTSGWEFEVRQDLSFLGRWGRRVSGFASWSMTDFPAPAAPLPVSIINPDGSTLTFTPSVKTVTMRANRFGGAGLQYAGDKLSIQLRGSYRNDNEIAGDRQTPTVNGTPIIIRKFQPAETRIDLNASYMLTKHYSLFLSGRDIFNGERDTVWRDDNGQFAGYAELSDRKRFGITWTFGVSGTW